jgi:hypothetical protein
MQLAHAASTLTLLLSAPLRSAPAAEEVALALPDLQIAFALAGVEEAAPIDTGPSEQLQGRWFGRFGRSELRISFWTFDRESMGLDSPEDVVDLIEDNRDLTLREAAEAERRDPGPGFRYQVRRGAPGPVGLVPYAYLGVHTRYEGTRPAAHELALGGILPAQGWAVEVAADPALGPQELARLEQSLVSAVTYEGPAQDPRWTDEELEARWLADAPKDVHEDLVALRTDHYLILSNCGKGSMKKFGKKMEECYAEIKAVYPFEEIPGERLMPVFLFRTNQQYYAYCTQVLTWTEDAARRSKGVAWKDFYATWYEAPNDPVHVHEATHQIFANRLRLPGGGSWFQEGVAEYMSTSKNDRKLFKRLVEDGRHVPLSTFTTIPSLLQSAGDERVDGTDEASEGYLQAACLIEFLRESDWSKDRFQELLHAVGRAPRGDVAAIEAAIGRVLGTDLAGLEERFVAYWEDRR